VEILRASSDFSYTNHVTDQGNVKLLNSPAHRRSIPHGVTVHSGTVRSAERYTLGIIFTMQNKQIDMHLAELTIKDFGIAVTLAVRNFPA